MSVRLRLLWFGLIVVMSGFYLLLSISAALDLDWAAARVAGGQYDSLPDLLRVFYLALAVISVGQVVLARGLIEHGGTWSPASARASMLLVILYVVLTVLSAISPSNDVRWTALPAFVLVVSLFMLHGPEVRSSAQDV